MRKQGEAARDFNAQAAQLRESFVTLPKVQSAFGNSNRTNTPKRTGNLRKSMSVRERVRGQLYRIHWTAPYAEYVNRRGRSRGFITRVFNAAVQTLQTQQARVLAALGRR